MNNTSVPNINSEIRSKGYAFLTEFFPSLPTFEIAQKIGSPVRDDSIGGVHKLIPKRRDDSKPNLYSGNFGFNNFPYHTDMAHWFKPPPYLLLRCIKGSKDVFTKLLHSEKIFEQLPINTIERALFKPRRIVKGQLALLRFKQSTNKSYLVRWDQLFITPSNNAAKDVSNFFEKITDDQSVKLLLNNPGDTLIIDNYKIFHGRTDVSENSSDRILERIYLNNLSYDN